MTNAENITFPSLAEAIAASLRTAIIHQHQNPDRQMDSHFIPRHDSSYIDIDVAVGEFKLRWLYSDRLTHSLTPSRACGSHYVVFINNLSVTDIADAEFLSLLRMHSHLRSDLYFKEPPRASFLSDVQYTGYLSSLLRSTLLRECPSDLQSYINKVAAEIDRFHGSVLRSC